MKRRQAGREDKPIFKHLERVILDALERGIKRQRDAMSR
jgi:hypothetical protein